MIGVPQPSVSESNEAGGGAARPLYSHRVCPPPALGAGSLADAFNSTAPWNVLLCPTRCPPTICGLVTGATVSTKKLRVAGVGSPAPPGDPAATSNTWLPSLRCSVVNGDEHADGLAWSTEQTKVAPASGSAVKANEGAGSFVAPSGPDVIAVSRVAS